MPGGMSDDTPFPPRFYWLKRLSALYVLLALATVGLRYAWLARASGRVERQIAAYRAAREPVWPGDFGPPPTAEERTVIRRFIAVAEPVSRAQSTGGPKVTLTDAQREAAMAQLRAARVPGGLNFFPPLDPPMVGVALYGLNEIRTMAQFAGDQAATAVATGDDAAAIERCREALALTRVVGRQPFLVSNLVEDGVSMLASGAVRRILPTLRAPTPAAREAALGLIRDLLDDDHLRIDAARAMYGERAMRLDLARVVGSGESVPWLGLPEQSPALTFAAWWLRPVVETEAAEMMDETTRYGLAAGAPDSARSRALQPPVYNPVGVTAHHVLLNPLDRVMRWSPLSFGRHYAAQWDRRAAAIDLAARLYALDHGAAPQRIEDLVPAYLPAVPTDPVRGGPMTRTFAPLSAATRPAGK
jgi:hypothetical protein